MGRTNIAVRGATASVLALAVILVFGCAWKVDDPPPVRGIVMEAWQPMATSIRIYPATSLAVDNGAVFLEARIEVLDQMGDAMKASGRYHVELLEAGQAGERTSGERLYAWTVDVLTLPQHETHYDSITRTYRFALKLDAPTPAERDLLVRAVLAPVHGQRVEAHARLVGGKVE